MAGPVMKLIGGCPFKPGWKPACSWVPHSKFRVLCEI